MPEQNSAARTYTHENQNNRGNTEQHNIGEKTSKDAPQTTPACPPTSSCPTRSDHRNTTPACIEHVVKLIHKPDQIIMTLKELMLLNNAQKVHKKLGLTATVPTALLMAIIALNAKCKYLVFKNSSRILVACFVNCAVLYCCNPNSFDSSAPLLSSVSAMNELNPARVVTISFCCSRM